MLRIRDVDHGSRIRLFSVPDPGSTSKNLIVLTLKLWSGNMIQFVHPGSGSWFFTHLGSRILESKRHRIPDSVLWIRDVYPDPGSDFFLSRIRIFSIPDPHQRIWVFEPKKLFLKLSEIWSGLFIPDPNPEKCSYFTLILEKCHFNFFFTVWDFFSGTDHIVFGIV